MEFRGKKLLLKQTEMIKLSDFLMILLKYRSTDDPIYCVLSMNLTQNEGFKTNAASCKTLIGCISS